MASGGIVKTLGTKVWTKFMDKVGSRLVSGMADTSSDAPNASHKPKRNVYAQMEEEKAQQRAAARRAATAAPATDGLDHDHGHDHGHDHEH